jgi:hypothetical protein
MLSIYFPALGLERIQLGTESQLRSAKTLRVIADSMLDVVAIEPEGAGIGLAAERYVDVRMVGVEMRDSYPFQAQAQILLHPREQISGVPPQIEALAKLG